MRVMIYRDGKPVSPKLDESDAFKWLLNHQPFSIDWACRYEGYEIREVKDDE